MEHKRPLYVVVCSVLKSLRKLDIQAESKKNHNKTSLRELSSLKIYLSQSYINVIYRLLTKLCIKANPFLVGCKSNWYIASLPSHFLSSESMGLLPVAQKVLGVQGVWGRCSRNR
jgi:hypothetical protein